jgi:ubiquitin-protein ligase E3 C
MHVPPVSAVVLELTMHLDLGEVVVTNLVPNGADRPVTAENRHLYILMVAHYRLKTQIRKQTDAFMEGLADIIDAKWLRWVLALYVPQKRKSEQ